MQRELLARSAWARLMERALQHPDLADPRRWTDASDQMQYERFVTALLSTAVEILAVNPTDAWRRMIKDDLGTHSDYLATDEFQSIAWPKLTSVLQELIATTARG